MKLGNDFVPALKKASEAANKEQTKDKFVTYNGKEVRFLDKKELKDKKNERFKTVSFKDYNKTMEKVENGEAQELVSRLGELNVSFREGRFKRLIEKIKRAAKKIGGKVKDLVRKKGKDKQSQPSPVPAAGKKVKSRKEELEALKNKAKNIPLPETEDAIELEALKDKAKDIALPETEDAIELEALKDKAKDIALPETEDDIELEALKDKAMKIELPESEDESSDKIYQTIARDTPIPEDEKDTTAEIKHGKEKADKGKKEGHYVILTDYPYLKLDNYNKEELETFKKNMDSLLKDGINKEEFTPKQYQEFLKKQSKFINKYEEIKKKLEEMG